MNYFTNTGGSRAPGFTLLELMVVVLIIALAASVVIPRFKRPVTKDQFVQRLSLLAQIGRNQAMVTNKQHRIWFDIKQKTVTLERETGEKKASGELVFQQVPAQYTKTVIAWPEELELVSFAINEKVDRGDIRTVYFMIMPGGLTQRVTIALRDATTDDVFSMIINPFTGRFTVQE